MKTVTISKDSWHLRFARYVTDDSDYEPEDICSYLRTLAGKTIGLALIAAVFLGFGGGVIYVVADFIAWIAWMLILGAWDMPNGGAAFAVGALCFASLVGGWRFGEYATGAAPKPEFAIAAWESIHDKICCRVKVR